MLPRIFRDRRALEQDPYNPDSVTLTDWDPALTIELEGAHLQSTSAVAVGDATRSLSLTGKTLYARPDADVRKGDRIRQGGDLDDFDSGEAFYVNVVPSADANPFTSWQPWLQVALDGAEG